MDNKTVPEHLLEKIAKMEKEYKISDYGFKVEAYYLSSDFNEDWRFRIVDSITNKEIVDCLQPDLADGHTYRLMLSGMKYCHHNGVKQGKEEALKRINKHLGDVVFNR